MIYNLRYTLYIFRILTSKKRHTERVSQMKSDSKESAFCDLGGCSKWRTLFGILYANIHTIRFRYHWLDIMNYWFSYHIFF